ncbi:MAG: hypothetical protein ABEH80_11105 [Halobaculum sp.]|jgi:hypothetical protein
MAETDDPITDVDERLAEESDDPTDDSLPDEAVLFAVTAFMALVTAGVFLADSIPNGSAVMPVTIAVGTALLGVRAYLQS